MRTGFEAFEDKERMALRDNLKWMRFLLMKLQVLGRA